MLLGLQLKKFLPVTIIITFAIFAVFLSLTALVHVTTEVFKSLVDADSALLGFLGIITVFVYNTYHDEIRFTERKMDDLLYEHKKPLEIQSMEAGFPAETRKAMDDKEHAEFETKTTKLEIRLKNLRQSAKESFSWTILSAAFFVVSISLALLAMTELGSFVGFLASYIAVASMGLGVYGLFAMIWSLRANLE